MKNDKKRQFRFTIYALKKYEIKEENDEDNGFFEGRLRINRDKEQG